MERIIPTSTNVVVCGTLLLLTLATTVLGRMNLDPFNLVIALAIAAGKAFMIALWFMHLRVNRGLMPVVAIGGLVWLLIFLLGSMDDYMTRTWLSVPGK